MRRGRPIQRQKAAFSCDDTNVRMVNDHKVIVCAELRHGRGLEFLKQPLFPFDPCRRRDCLELTCDDWIESPGVGPGHAFQTDDLAHWSTSECTVFWQSIIQS